MLRNFKKQLTVVCSTACMVLAVGCGKTVIKAKSKMVHVDGVADANANQADQQPNASAEDPQSLSLADLQSAYGIRSFEQINETMAAVTGISPTTAAINTVYLQVKSQLPNNNDIKAFLASQQVGVSKLAVEYCDALMLNTTQRARVVPSYNFAAVPSVAFSASGSAQLINSLLASFWGSGLEGLPDPEETRQTLETLVDELLVSENMNDAAVTLKVSKGVCSAVLSAAPVTIF